MTATTNYSNGTVISTDWLNEVDALVFDYLPNVTGVVTPTHTELNYVGGVTSAIQTQLDAKIDDSVFPNVSGNVTPTHTELNYVDGVTSAIQAQLDARSGRGYLDGCVLSTAGSSATMSVAAGSAMDSTTVCVMVLSAIAKTTSAWAVGTAQGGLDTGAIANSTWYHFYVIRRPDTGVVDVVFSTSASSPTLPTNYTQYRRIGSGKTNGSAQWTKFTQTGDTFEWDVAVYDVGQTNPGATAQSKTLTVPTGVVVEAIFNGGSRNAGTGVSAATYFSPLHKSDEAPLETGIPLWGTGANVSNGAGGARASYTLHRVFTNTSAQIRVRVLGSDADVTLNVATLGWVDSRGRNA